ncbi:MAG: stage III sporulation protein AF [Corallococcus sp.]|nr:stage III sporulation protein AF [Bacillota bacterium]MCM1533998.1 stage III sporulation protein AF [Corallococcus sp.]
MVEWILTVTGIAVMSILCDVILPEGQTRKYIKTVFGVLVTLIMIQPLIGLLDTKEFSVSSDNTTVAIQQSYLDNVERRKTETSLNTVLTLLKAKGITVEDYSLSNTYDRLTLKLGVSFTEENDAVVKSIMSTCLPDVDIITYWK